MDGEEKIKHSHLNGVGTAIFFVLAFGRASSRDVVSAHTSFCLKFSLGRGWCNLYIMRLFKILPVIFTLITNFCFAQSVVYRIITDKPLTKLPFEYAHKSTKVSFPKLSNDQIQEFTDVYSREESGISRITIVIKKNGKK